MVQYQTVKCVSVTDFLFICEEIVLTIECGVVAWRAVLQREVPSLKSFNFLKVGCPSELRRYLLST